MDIKEAMLNLETSASVTLVRHKREIWLTLTRGATKIVGYAVSNLLESVFSTSETEAVAKPNQVVEFYKKFDVDNLYKFINKEYLKVCSETSDDHNLETGKEAQRLPTLVWATAKAHGEILANSANINAIASMAQHGRMATKELVELMKDDLGLETIDPESTNLHTIKLNIDRHAMTFGFYSYSQFSVAPNLACGQKRATVKFSMGSAHKEWAKFSNCLNHSARKCPFFL